VLEFSFCQIILYSLGLVRWWTADFKQFPRDTVLYDWCLTMLTVKPPVAQWLEHPHENSEGHELDSHLDLGIFSERSGVRIKYYFF